jgi:hypothetical protein
MQDPACNILKSRHHSTRLSGAGEGSRPGSVARNGPAEQAYKPGDEHRSADWPFATVGRVQRLEAALPVGVRFATFGQVHAVVV